LFIPSFTICDSPHPGNIFVLDDGQIGLIDYGQVKQISGRSRETLCKVMIALDERTDDIIGDMQRVGDLALELGVTIKENALPEAPAAIGIWLFDGSVTELPGGYDLGELSPNSPVKEIQSFPQDLVLVGRSSILIKGIANRLNIPWSLAQKWAPMARKVLEQAYKPQQQQVSSSSNNNTAMSIRVRFRDVIRTFQQWCAGRITRFVQKLPKPIRTRIVTYIVRYEERKSLRKERARKQKQQKQQLLPQ
jgi:predicted unusual protein kinase regulating ubiquinone biosynthesis (AarF/ABC1/UbiB family)